MSQEKISDIEKRIAELKFLERDLFRERDICRIKSLDKAERSLTVDNIIKNHFLSMTGALRKELIINSIPTKLSGRNNEEFISEVKVEIKYKSDRRDAGYNEVSLSIYLNNGFLDHDVQKNEKRIMDRLVALREEVENLKNLKKKLKSGS